MNNKFWVVMTNGKTKDNRIKKLVYECESMDEALKVQDDTISNQDIKHVNIRIKKPYYNSSIYQVTYKKTKL